MTETTIYVPWFNLEEWISVRDMLVSSDMKQLRRAYQLIRMWKVRFPSLPVNVECTLGVLQVLVKEESINEKYSETLYGVKYEAEEDLQLAYSTAIMRFVNHVSSERGNTLYAVAKKNKIPDWIINLRHSIAHGQNLPALVLLRKAAQFAFRWLLSTYWSIQDSNMSALDGSSIEHSAVNELTKIQHFFKFSIKVLKLCDKADEEGTRFVAQFTDEQWVIIIRLWKKLKKIARAKNLNGYKALLEVVKEGKKYKALGLTPSKEKGFRINELVSIIMKILDSITSKQEVSNDLVDCIFETDFLIDFESRNRYWVHIINLFHERNVLPFLIQILLGKWSDGSKEESKQALKWLDNLAVSLVNLLTPRSGKRKNGETNEKLDCIIPLKNKQLPSLTLEIFKPVLLNPSSEIMMTLKKFLDLLVPPIPTKTKSMIKELLTIYCTEGHCNDVKETDASRLFDVSDLLDNVLAKNSLSDVDIADGTEYFGKWKKVRDFDPEIWHRVPLGLLPGQIKPDL